MITAERNSCGTADTRLQRRNKMTDTPKIQQAADGGCPPATCSPDVKSLTRRIDRLVKWGNGFETFMARFAPGFKQPHEARIYKHFWMEIDDQIEEIANTLKDNRGTIMAYVHNGGYVQVRGNAGNTQQLNTAKRTVDFILANV
jgi:hypothetical protein